MRASLNFGALAPRTLHQQHGDERALRRDHPRAVMMWVLARFSSAFRNRRDGQAYEIFELFHQGDSA